jgi:hypothetical protein
MTVAQEQKLAEIDVLAFDNTTGDYLYSSEGAITAVNNEAGTANVRFVAQPREGAQAFVIIANARPQVTSALAAAGNPQKATLLPGLEVSVSDGARWPSDGTAPIPMWGETEPVTIAPPPATPGPLFTSTTPLLRALARVTVTVIPGIQSKFKLTSVRLYNTNTSGRVVPDASNLTAMKATAPTLPLDPGERTGMASAILYNAAADFTVKNVSMLNAIYTFERAASTGNPVTLVIGGKYDGSSIETYYKVVPGGNTPVALLRNHSYDITITAVEKAGWTSPGAAYDGRAENVEATITAWDESTYDENVAFRQRLAVDKSHFDPYTKSDTGEDR